VERRYPERAHSCASQWNKHLDDCTDQQRRNIYDIQYFGVLVGKEEASKKKGLLQWDKVNEECLPFSLLFFLSFPFRLLRNANFSRILKVVWSKLVNVLVSCGLCRKELGTR